MSSFHLIVPLIGTPEEMYRDANRFRLYLNERHLPFSYDGSTFVCSEDLASDLAPHIEILNHQSRSYFSLLSTAADDNPISYFQQAIADASRHLPEQLHLLCLAPSVMISDHFFTAIEKAINELNTQQLPWSTLSFLSDPLIKGQLNLDTADDSGYFKYCGNNLQSSGEAAIFPLISAPTYGSTIVHADARPHLSAIESRQVRQNHRTTSWCFTKHAFGATAQHFAAWDLNTSDTKSTDTTEFENLLTRIQPFVDTLACCQTKNVALHLIDQFPAQQPVPQLLDRDSWIRELCTVLEQDFGVAAIFISPISDSRMCLLSTTTGHAVTRLTPESLAVLFQQLQAQKLLQISRVFIHSLMNWDTDRFSSILSWIKSGDIQTTRLFHTYEKPSPAEYLVLDIPALAPNSYATRILRELHPQRTINEIPFLRQHTIPPYKGSNDSITIVYCSIMANKKDSFILEALVARYHQRFAFASVGPVNCFKANPLIQFCEAASYKSLSAVLNQFTPALVLLEGRNYLTTHFRGLCAQQPGLAIVSLGDSMEVTQLSEPTLHFSNSDLLRRFLDSTSDADLLGIIFSAEHRRTTSFNKELAAILSGNFPKKAELISQFGIE